MILDYEPGDKATTPKNKDWGIGQVQSIIKEKVTVNFENVGKKVINANLIELIRTWSKMDLKEKKKIVLDLIGTFETASKLSLSLRKKGLKETIKEDNTPVTNGDLEVNKIFIDKISELTPNIPIVSEETPLNKNLDNLSTFWLIDPIDGTYDYINNKDEFTLNAALIINKVPEIGVISAPAKNRLFYTYGDGNSFEIINDKAQLLNSKINTSDQKNIKAVSYSDKLKKEIKDVHDKFKVANYTKMKSSLKFCVVAAGEFDLYVAEPRASEWDVAAGDAILTNSGGSITDMDGNKIYYGKKDFKNPGIILKSARLNNGWTIKNYINYYSFSFHIRFDSLCNSKKLH